MTKINISIFIAFFFLEIWCYADSPFICHLSESNGNQNATYDIKSRIKNDSTDYWSYTEGHLLRTAPYYIKFSIVGYKPEKSLQLLLTVENAIKNTGEPAEFRDLTKIPIKPFSFKFRDQFQVTVQCDPLNLNILWPAPLGDCEISRESLQSLDDLKNLIKSCGVKSVDELMTHLPEEFLKYYVLAYSSHSLQKASPEFPRVLSFNHDASLTLGISGDPGDPRYQVLEAMEFNQKEKRFNFQEINFQSRKSFSNAYRQFGQLNPPKCLACHGQSQPRPNWSNYPFWTGFFGADDGDVNRVGAYVLHTQAEQPFFDRFYSHVNSPRYQSLTNEDVIPFKMFGRWGPTALVSPPLTLGIAYSSHNLEKIAWEIRQIPSAGPFRYAILAASTCVGSGEMKITDFIPALTLEKFSTTLRKEEENICRERVQAELNDHHEYEKLLPAPTGNNKLKQKITSPDFCPLHPESYASATTTALMFIMDNLHYDTTQWSMRFDRKKYFEDGLGEFGNLEFALWDQVLDPVKDKDLYLLYRDAKLSLYPGDGPRVGFAQNVCPLLEKKSVKAISTQEGWSPANITISENVR